MDWDSGLVTGLSAEHLGAAGARASRTVSRVLAWARDVGLLVVVEPGASKEFLGSRTNRAPSYALVSDRPLPQSLDIAPSPSATPVDESGDLPMSYVSSKPLPGGRRVRTQAKTDWPTFRVPESPDQRTAASLLLLQRTGLDRRGVSEVAPWRARALLKQWWDEGFSVAGLLYAIDHHPDHPDISRGDALHGAKDPLRVIGYRLQPWKGRTRDLPAAVTGHRGDYLAARTEHRNLSPTPPAPCSGSHQVRQAARIAVEKHLASLRARRRDRPSHG